MRLVGRIPGALDHGHHRRERVHVVGPGRHHPAVGDQLNYLKTVLAVSHEDQGFAYQVQYSQFVGGPPMLQAFQGGALDTGFVCNTPLIFAQAAGQPLVAVAAWESKGSGDGLLTAPGVTSVTGWSSLKGKRVAYQVGIAGEVAARDRAHPRFAELRSALLAEIGVAEPDGTPTAASDSPPSTGPSVPSPSRTSKEQRP